jgi:Dolichyl-phosphate-mannose-protein mannosyltransferase
MRLRPAAVTAALILAAFLSAYGIWWGWGESWNPDEMAFRGVFAEGRFLEPGDYKKPPFHTYTNLVLSVGPFKLAQRAAKVLTGADLKIGPAMLYWSRVLQIMLFLGIVYLSFRIVARSCEAEAASAIALLTASSAGFVLQTHFLTADTPVVFWMLAAFYCAQSIVFDPRLRTYVIAGLLTGIATATKYNGLAVGLALPVFHLYANRDRPWAARLFDPRLVVGVAMVLLGFWLGNPYSVFDFQRFAADFAYNYAVTPVYNGHSANHYGFMIFLRYIPEIIGWPVTVASVVAAVYAIWRLRVAALVERASVAAALGVFLLYFLQFGRAPRIEARFVLPVASFLLIATAPFWSVALRRYRAAAATVLAGLIAYNILASLWVDKRFAEDPRMAAQSWVRSNLPAHESIESSPYSPRWNVHSGIDVDDARMPGVSGRRRVLSKLFASNQSMLTNVLTRETEADIDWYKPATLAQRHPAFIAVDSIFYERFLDADDAGDDYPDMRQYLTDLLGNRLGYHIAFDQTAQQSPAWLYPQDMQFVDNRIVILARNGSAPQP